MYPRNADLSKLLKAQEPALNVESSVLPEPSSPPRPPATPLRKPKKRSSDGYDMEQSSKGASNSVREKGREDRTSSRKHRSLGVTVPSSASSRDKGKERRHESLASTALKPITSAVKSERHSRQTSASSSSSNHGDGTHPRRMYPTDFARLPPSPSSSSIQQFLRQANGMTIAPSRSVSREPNIHSSPNVAHSLLRGTQEGWSSLDDEATAEALRKLDGLGGKIARARASIGSLNRAGSVSRPGTPSSSRAGAQWEGLEGAKVLRRDSSRSKESIAVKDRDHGHLPPLGSISSEFTPEAVDFGGSAKGEDPSTNSSGPEKNTKKSGTASARSSFTPKRTSASSTTYTGTPTTTSSSRDSGSLSTATSATSISNTSGRYSSGKLKRNSASSDVSSIHSGDATSLKDRVAALATSGDVPEDDFVPPVPPLPKDLTTYRSPPHSTTSLGFPHHPIPDDKRRSNDGDKDRTVSLEVPPFSSSPTTSPSSSGQEWRLSQQYAIMHESAPAITKTPSKKWSFSNALSLIAHSPSSTASSGHNTSGHNTSVLTLNPRSVNLGHPVPKCEPKGPCLASVGPVSPKCAWPAKLPDAMASVGSLISMSSVGSGGKKESPVLPAITTSDRRISSRSETSSSGSTNHTTSVSTNLKTSLSPSSSLRRGASVKRLTPSSIPFFRRSSSQSMQLPPSNPVAAPPSPAPSSGQLSSTPARSKASTSSTQPLSLSSPARVSAQKKSSVLSLGLPSLLRGSSSRRSMHVEYQKEAQRAKDTMQEEGMNREQEKEKQQKQKQKKEEKERSESRISVLMGRKRGKVSIFCYYGLYIYAYRPLYADAVFNGCQETKDPGGIASNADVCLTISNGPTSC